MPNENGSANPFATELTGAIKETESMIQPLENPEDIGEVEGKPETTDKSEKTEEYIPKRLRGKTKEQIYHEFSGLEADYSRMGNELGEARSLLRETLEKALTANKVEEPITEEDILSKPRESVQKLIDAALKPVKEATVSAEQRALMLEFNMRHPGYQETAKSPEFKDWLSESSYRTRLFTQASKFDMDAAEDLFTAFSEYKKSGATTDTNEKRREIRNASTETGGAGKSTSKTGKKIYRSTDLMRLYNTDRERYNEMSAEIQLAFQEGRVR